MKNALAAMLLLAGTSAPLFAVVAPASGATMLAPGVYTTPEISAKCQQYAAKRVGYSSAGDRERTTVFIACVRKLSGNPSGAPPAASAYAPQGPMIEAPVSLTPYGGGWYGSVCSTDEGYGRRGNCSSG
jgi:hypothetical protein